MVKSKNKINTYENTFDIRKPKLFLQNNKSIHQEEYKNPYLNKNLIQMYSIPSIVSLRNLNNLNVKSYSKNKISQSFNEFNSKQKIFNLEDEKKQMNEEAKMYKAYNYYGEDDDNDNSQNNESYNEEDELNLDLLLGEFNKKESNNSSSNKNKYNKNKDNNSDNNSNHKQNKCNNSLDISDEDDEDKTISLDDENINFFCENLSETNNSHKNQKILLAPFDLNRHPNKDVVKYFLEHNDIYEEVLQILFHFDNIFGLQFLMSISDIDNSIISLINYITNNIFNSRLRLEILNIMNYKNKLKKY